MTKCSICKKEIKLTPSAAERAKKYGGKPSDYSELFTSHSKCQALQNKEDVTDLMRRIKTEKQMSRVIYPFY